MSLFFGRSVHLAMYIILIAFIVVMVRMLLLLLLAILVTRIAAYRRLMPRWSVVSVLGMEMLQGLPDAGHIRISKDLGGRRL